SNRPPLPCRASPPQGGRLAVIGAFANHQRVGEVEAADLPLEGEMSPKATEGVV
ncbi:MAG: D-alanyl-D-alanine dipeptidase, partial [Mesorhizobium sp.]